MSVHLAFAQPQTGAKRDPGWLHLLHAYRALRPEADLSFLTSMLKPCHTARQISGKMNKSIQAGL